MMKRFVRGLMATLALSLLWSPAVFAQDTIKAVAVSGCGTLPWTPVAGNPYPITADATTGALCIGGLTIGAVTIADGANVTFGAKADSIWDGSAASVTSQSYQRYTATKAEAVRAAVTSVIGTFGATTANKTVLYDSTGAAVDYTKASPIVGDIAAGLADGTGAPVKTGGLAKTADPTAVSDSQRVADLHDILGKKVVIPALRSQKGKQATTITSSAAETTIVTAGATGVFEDVYGLIISNTSASDGSCAVKDSTAGTTQVTIAVKAGSTGGFTVDAGSAMPQTTAANNWTATCTSLASWNITAMFVSTKG